MNNTSPRIEPSIRGYYVSTAENDASRFVSNEEIALAGDMLQSLGLLQEIMCGEERERIIAAIIASTKRAMTKND